jgi:hypothetical protein
VVMIEVASFDVVRVKYDARDLLRPHLLISPRGPTIDKKPKSKALHISAIRIQYIQYLGRFLLDASFVPTLPGTQRTKKIYNSKRTNHGRYIFSGHRPRN